MIAAIASFDGRQDLRSDLGPVVVWSRVLDGVGDVCCRQRLGRDVLLETIQSSTPTSPRKAATRLVSRCVLGLLAGDHRYLGLSPVEQGLEGFLALDGALNDRLDLSACVAAKPVLH